MKRPAVLIGVVAVILATAAFWIMSRDGYPTSLFQGQAAWHLLTAASVGAFCLYLGGEETPRPVGSE